MINSMWNSEIKHNRIKKKNVFHNEKKRDLTLMLESERGGGGIREKRIRNWILTVQWRLPWCLSGAVVMSLRLLGINIPTKYGSSHRRASLPVNRKRLLCSITPWYRGRRRGEVERLERDRRYPISWYIDLLLASNFLIIPASKETTRLEIRLLRASLSYRKSYFFFLNSRST